MPADQQRNAPDRSRRGFKIWISVEAFDEKSGSHLDLMDEAALQPISLGVFRNLREAWERILQVAGTHLMPVDWKMLDLIEGIEDEVWKEGCDGKDRGRPRKLALDLKRIDWKALREE